MAQMNLLTEQEQRHRCREWPGDDTGGLQGIQDELGGRGLLYTRSHVRQIAKRKPLCSTGAQLSAP